MAAARHTSSGLAHRNVCAAIAAFVLVLVGQPPPACAQSALDGFNPGANGRVHAAIVQANGRIVVGGEFTAIGVAALTVERRGVARINPDGSVDPTFDPGANGVVRAVMEQADGKLVVGGDFTVIGGAARQHLARLNADGSLDAAFDPGANDVISAIAIQPDGRIVVGGDFTTLGGGGTGAIARGRIGRLNSDGSIDPTFNPGADATVLALSVQANERILVGGAFQRLGGGATDARRHLGRLLPNGELDAGFNPGANGAVRAFALSADGAILVGGDFDAIGGGTAAVRRDHLARLAADGVVDSTFATGTNNAVYALLRQWDGRVVLGGAFTAVDSGGASLTRNRLARLSADGSLDVGFDPNPSGPVFALALQADQKIVVAGGFAGFDTGAGALSRSYIGRLNADGTVDGDFSPGANNAIVAMAVQPDGKVIVGGLFTTLGGVRRSYIGRLNVDGSVDTGFNPGADDAVYALAVQPDGKVVVGGSFTTMGGGGSGVTARQRLARLNTDGSLDETFDPGANNPVYALALQPDGRILVGGQFTTLGGGGAGAVPRRRLARLASDGSVDLDFDPGADNPVYAITLQTDGKILTGGSFTLLGGGGIGNAERAFLGRLLPDGSVDDFNPGADGDVYAMAVDPGGKIVVAGSFTRLGGGGTGTTPRAFVGRLNVDSTIDADFNPGADGDVRSVALQADGRILLGGTFTRLGGGGYGNTVRYRIGRLNADGSVDPSFDPGANNTVLALAVQGDGKILVAGAFTTLGGGGTGVMPRSKIGRLTNPDGTAQRVSVTNAGRTLGWWRGGTTPEIAAAVYEYSDDGTNYSRLGIGARVEGEWQWDGPPLPVNRRVLIRRRGSYATGHGNGSSSLIESIHEVYLAMPRIGPLTIGATAAGSPYSMAFEAAGAVGVVTFTTTSRLPAGLALSGTGLLSGTPSETGHFPLTIAVTDRSSGLTATAEVGLTVGCPTIVLGASFPTGTLGAAYAPVSVTQTGAVGSAAFSLAAGALPAGLSFSTAGVVSGAPSEGGSFSFTIRVADANGCGASATYAMSVFARPTMVSQPASQVIPVGGVAAFNAAVTGYPAPTLQWQVSPDGSTWTALANGPLYSGATTGTLIIGGVPEGLNASQFRLIATNSAGVVVSNPALLTVVTAPVIGGSPASRVVTTGEPASFSVSATGNPAPAYRWQLLAAGGSAWIDLADASPYSGSGTATLNLSAVSAGMDGYRYRAVVTNSVGSAVSAAATLTVHTAPAISASPSSQTLVAGTTVTFGVAATGNPTPGFKWQFLAAGASSWADVPTGVPYSGATTATLMLVGVPPAFDGYQFRAVATNRVGSATSAAAVLTVHTTPAVSVSPSSQTVVAGQTVAFSVAATGNPAPDLQWQMMAAGGSWTNLTEASPYAGARSATLTVATAASLNGLQYRAIATNSIGSAASSAAALTVHWAPTMTAHPANQTVNAGAAAVFSAAASANPAPAYQWQVSLDGGSSWSDLAAGGAYGGVTTSTMTIASAPLGFNAQRYRLLARNAVGTTPSNPALLTVNAVSDPHMAVEAPSSAATVRPPFLVSGWAVDLGAAAGPGVDAVRVEIYPLTNGSVGSASLVAAASVGLSRPDIGAAFGAVFTNAGYSLDVPNLEAGSYRVIVSARSVVTGTFADSRAVDVTVPAPVSDPAMAVDDPAHNATTGPGFIVSGWAIDRGAWSGIGVDIVHVWAFPMVDGTPGNGFFVGAATLGLSRPDVGAVYGGQFTNSGYSLRASSFAPGSYRLIVYAHSMVSGAFDDWRARDFTVVQPVSNPAMALDAPVNGSAVSSSFSMAGWAIDRGEFETTGVDTVHIWAFPISDGTIGNGIFLGQANYGLPRTDVGAVFGERFTNSGFGLEASGLAAGAYRVVAYARSTIANAFNNSKSADIVVSGATSGTDTAGDRAGTDGQAGPAYAAMFPSDEPSSVLAGGTALWVRDETGASDAAFENTQWTIVKPATPTESPISAVSVSRQGDLAWVGHTSGEVYRGVRAADPGPSSWAAVGGGTLPGRAVTAIAVDPSNTNVAYAAFEHGEGGTLWKTGDGGVSWTSLAGAAPPGLRDATVRAVAVPRDRPELVYVGTDRGLFVSHDGGVQWTEGAGGAGRLAVSQLFNDGPRLVVVTRDAGVFAIPLQLEDVGTGLNRPLR